MVDISARAQSYALTIREKWAFGECGEDILLLVLNSLPAPTIFISWGPLVAEKFTNSPSIQHSPLRALDPLRKILEEANTQLKNGYPLNKVRLS